MLDLNDVRREFEGFLASDPTRFRMDAAFAHAVELAYRKGYADGCEASAIQPQELAAQQGQSAV